MLSLQTKNNQIINNMQLRVKEICKQKGVLFKDLAAQLGVTDIWLRSSLKGNPTIGTLEKIAAALGVEVSALFAAPAEGVINCPYCGKPIALHPSEVGGCPAASPASEG